MDNLILIFNSLNIETVSYFAQGINGIKDTLISNWIGPAFLLAVAGFAIMFIKDRAWMKLIGFFGIAALVGVLIFANDALFGSSGSIKKAGEGLATQINTINTAGIASENLAKITS